MSEKDGRNEYFISVYKNNKFKLSKLIFLIFHVVLHGEDTTNDETHNEVTDETPNKVIDETDS